MPFLVSLQAKAELPGAEQPLWLRIVGTPLEALFRSIVALRTRLWHSGWLQSVRLPGHTISVGNIMVGGTGKTPVIIALCRHFGAQGRTPIVLSRGYGSGLRSGQFAALYRGRSLHTNGADPNSLAPDEAVLVSQQVPETWAVLGADRVAAARWFQTLGLVPTELWLLDDGFQHHRIQRDVDIVLLNAELPLGNGHLFPRGLLREPLTALRRCHVIGWTRYGGAIATAIKDQVTAVTNAPQFLIPFTEVAPRPLAAGHGLGNKILIVAGIAHPAYLLASIEKQGLGWHKTLFKNDHESFTKADISSVCADCTGVITTAKDYARHPDVFDALDLPVAVADVTADLPAAMLDHIRQARV